MSTVYRLCVRALHVVGTARINLMAQAGGLQVTPQLLAALKEQEATCGLRPQDLRSPHQKAPGEGRGAGPEGGEAVLPAEGGARGGPRVTVMPPVLRGMGAA